MVLFLAVIVKAQGISAIREFKYSTTFMYNAYRNKSFVSVDGKKATGNAIPKFFLLFRLIIWSPLIDASVVRVFQIRAFVPAQFLVNTFNNNAAVLVFTYKRTNMLGGTANTAFFNQI